MKSVLSIAIVLCMATLAAGQSVMDIFPISKAPNLEWQTLLISQSNCANGVCSNNQQAVMKIVPVTVKTFKKRRLLPSRSMTYIVPASIVESVVPMEIKTSTATQSTVTITETIREVVPASYTVRLVNPNCPIHGTNYHNRSRSPGWRIGRLLRRLLRR